MCRNGMALSPLPPRTGEVALSNGRVLRGRALQPRGTLSEIDLWGFIREVKKEGPGENPGPEYR